VFYVVEPRIAAGKYQQFGRNLCCLKSSFECPDLNTSRNVQRMKSALVLLSSYPINKLTNKKGLLYAGSMKGVTDKLQDFRVLKKDPSFY
jgi:hypothetical protein